MVQKYWHHVAQLHSLFSVHKAKIKLLIEWHLLLEALGGMGFHTHSLCCRIFLTLSMWPPQFSYLKDV